MTRAHVCAASLWFAACGGSQGAAVAPPLHGTITAVEVTESGKRLDVPDTGTASVDINSTVHLQMNLDEIAKQMARHVGLDFDEVATLQKQLAAMKVVTEAQTKAIERLEALNSENLDEDAFIAATEDLGTIDKQVHTAVCSYADTADIMCSELWSEKRYERINAERNALLDRQRGLSVGLASVQWRVEALLRTSGKSAPIHLPNYDSLEEGQTHIVAKLLPTNIGALKDDFETARQLADGLNELIKKRGGFMRLLGEKLDALWREYEDIVLAARSDLRTLADELAALPEKVKKIPEVSSLLSRTRKVRDAAEDARDSCSNVLSAIRNLTSGADSRLMLSAVEDSMRCGKAVGSSIEVLSAELPGAADDARKLIERATATKPVKELAAIAERLRTVSALEDAYERAHAAWGTALAFIGAAGPELSKPVWRTDNFTDRAHDEITNTAIELIKTDRVAGDMVTFRAYLIKDNQPIVTGGETTMKVVRAGFNLLVGASVNFVHPTDLDEGEDAFSAAPGVTAALHYRVWRDTGKARADSIWNFFDPGLGIHVVYPDLGAAQKDAMGTVTENDPTFELGVGGVVQLFGDFVQAGYGYDLQTERDYWYVGFGLQRLLDLGITIPSG